MSILCKGNINLLSERGKSEDINELEREFDELYQEALVLKNNPESSDYKGIKKDLWIIYNKIDVILRG